MASSFFSLRHFCERFTGGWFYLLLALLLQSSKGTDADSTYLIGLGSYDITGPAADVNMMGYAMASQIASGVHVRLQARTFIVAEPVAGGNRVAFVNLDACMASQLVMIKVIERLKTRYGGIYNEKNVAVSGIHTHAGPGGYLQYVVYIVTSFGFVRQSFDAIVDGIEQSIIQAHENLHTGTIFVNKGEIPDAGINRSPSAYLNNPAAERSQYKDNIDKEMTLLKFVDNKWGPIGSFNWFATHGTSMSNTNSLISGDNKGAAARFMEDWVAGGVGVALATSVFFAPGAALAVLDEPPNALSLPTWAIHVSSVVEWVTAMVLVWEYGEKSGFEAWKGLSWGMVPLLGGALCACTWHFFYNSESLEVLVALQAGLTVIGNMTMCFAAFRIFRASQEGSNNS